MPSPTTLRPVSGKKRRRGTENVKAKMARKPKIHFQPAYCARIPPSMGPSLFSLYSRIDPDQPRSQGFDIRICDIPRDGARMAGKVVYPM